MEFLAALKKDPLCHSASPSETVSGLSSLFGAVILQHHRAPWLLHSPECLHLHACLGKSLLAAPLRIWMQLPKRHKESIFQSSYCLALLNRPHFGSFPQQQRGSWGKTGCRFNCINSLGYIPDAILETSCSPCPWDLEPTQHATVTPSCPLTQGQDLHCWQQAVILTL